VVLQRILRAGEGKILRRLNRIADAVESLADDYTDLSDADLQAKTDEFKERYADGETLDALLPEAFAVVRGRRPARSASATSGSSSWVVRRCTSATSPR